MDELAGRKAMDGDILDNLRKIRRVVSAIPVDELPLRVQECRVEWNRLISKVKADMNASIDDRIRKLEDRRQDLLGEIEKISEDQNTAFDQALDVQGLQSRATNLLFSEGYENDDAVHQLYESCIRLRETVSSLCLPTREGLRPIPNVKFEETDVCVTNLAHFGIVTKTEYTFVLPPAVNGIGQRFDKLGAVAVCPQSGRIYVADGNHVRSFHQDGTPINDHDTVGFFSQLAGLTVDKKGHVICIGTSSDERLIEEALLMIFDIKWNWIKKFSIRPLLVNCCLTSDSDNNIYVAGGNNINIISPDRKHIHDIGKGLLKPASIAVSERGQVYACDRERNEVFAFDAKGNVLCRFRQDCGAKLQSPMGICVNSRGQILVGNNIAKPRVDVYSPKGELLGHIINQEFAFEQISAIGITPNGRIVVADMILNKIVSF